MKKSDQVCPLYRAGAVSIQLALLGLIAAPAVDAATVTLTTTDTLGTTSMDTDGVNNWSDGLDPSAGNDYVVNVEWLRTPTSGDLVFAGDSLTVQADGGIINKNGGAQTLTVDLILDGGLVRSGAGSGDTFTLAGTLDVTANNGALVPDQSPYIINSDITGAGTLYLLNDASLYGFSSASGSGFGIDITGTGTMSGDVVADASDMVWSDTSSWLFTVGASGTNNSITGSGDATFNGEFLFDLTGASSNPGDSWTILDITTTTIGETFTVGTAGFAQSGSVWTDGTYTFNPLSGILAVAEPPTEWFVDADGTWSTAANWSTAAVPAAGSDALLGSIITENRTVTLDTNVSLNSLTLSNPVNTGDYFIVADTNETLTLTGESKIDVAGRHWINAEVVTSIGLNVMGGGELVLDADNSISGGLNVDGSSVSVLNTDAISAGNDIAVTNGGQVQFFGADNGFFSDNGATGYGTGTVDGNVSLDATSAIRVNDGADVAFTGVISGDGAVSASNGTVGFSTAHTYGGTTTLSGTSTLTVSGAGTLGAADGTAATRTLINDSAQLVLDNASLGDEYIVLGERGVDAVANISSSGNNTIAGNMYADIPGEGSHYIIESTSGTLTLSGTLSAWDEAAPNDRFYVFEGAGNINLTGQITDLLVDENGDPTVDLISDGNNVHVVKRGSGTMTVATSTTDANDFWRGRTVVEEGTLKVQAGASNAGELFSSSIEVQAGAVFDTSTFTTYSMQVTQDPDGTAFNGDEIGQTLAGAGTVNTGSGTLSAYEDASFAPGDDGIGTLSISGNLSYTPTIANPNGGMNYELSSSAAGSNDLLDVSGTATMSASGGGSYNVNITPVDNALESGAAYTLVQAGTLSGTASAANFSGTIVNSDGEALNTRLTPSFTVNSGASGNVQVSFSGSALSRTWNGNASSDWDVATSSNWQEGDQQFMDLDSVTFDGSASGSKDVNVAQNVTAGSMTVSGAAYSFSGSNISAGSVMVNSGGTASFANTVSGDVAVASTGTLAGAGTFSNNVSVQAGGTLQVGSAGMPSSSTSAGLLDDFDSYSTGATNTATGDVWNAEPGASANSNIVASDSGNALQTIGGTAWSGAERDLSGTDAAVVVGETKTYFWQVQPSYTSDGSGWDYDFMMGLSPDVSNIDSTDAWSDFGVMPYINNEATSPYINANAPTSPWWAAMTAGEWANVWVVINNDSTDPTFDLYYQTSTDAAPVLVAADANWRGSESGIAAGVDLNAIGFMAAGNTGTEFLIDNIWYSGGENLTSPLETSWSGSTTIFSPETMTVEGDLVLVTGATLEVDIASSGVNDLLSVIGELTAAGTLEVSLETAAPELSEGDVFDILDFGSITGAFDLVNLPTLTGSLEWDTSSLMVDGVIQVIASALLDGDLNGDGFVGLDDLDIVLTSWNQNVTAGEWSEGDPSGDGFVGLDDLDFVLTNWNNGTPPSSGAAVPEPASLVLLGLGGMALLKRRSA